MAPPDEREGAGRRFSPPEILPPDAEDGGPASLWSRRDFFSLAAWAGVLASLAAALVGFGRYMFPRVLFEPSPQFDAGRPADYVSGQVDERWKKDQRVWIVRQDDGSFFALLAICTHLGCTPNWIATDDKFKCPCHGSGYKRDGRNFEGPTPRPLDRVKIALNAEGHLIVDKSVLYKMGPGRVPAQQHPESVLHVTA